MYKRGLEISREVDGMLLEAIAGGYYDPKDAVFLRGDFYAAAMKFRADGVAPEKDLKFGPYQSSYEKLCSSVGKFSSQYFI